MPRWISLLALCTLALVAGASVSWAEVPVAVETHETIPPADSEPPVEGGEEALLHLLSGDLEVAIRAERAVRGRFLIGARAVPAVPPPR